LEKKAAWRYQSAGELADDLKNWLDGIPLVRPTEALNAKLLRTMPSHFGRWGSIGALLLCLALTPLLFRMNQPILPRDSASRQDGLESVLAEETRARPGRPYFVFGPNKPLRWSRVEAGEDTAKVLHKPGKLLSLNTLSVCLVEVLPPNPLRKSFRLIVQMRHTDAIKAGGIGIYFGRVRHLAAARAGHSFGKVEYAEPHLRALAGEELENVPLEQVHCVDLGIGFVREMGQRPPQTHRWSTGVRVPLPRVKVPDDRSVWRTLKVEIAPESTWLLGENQERRELRRPVLEASFRALQLLHRDLRSVAATFPISGGIGIFVFGGSAEIHSIQFEPLR
jgi:hypothetical protein